MQLTKNFNIDEFIYSKFYNQHQQNRVIFDFYNDPELLYQVQKLACQLEVLRKYLNNPTIIINIAYRPKWYELERGRSGNSKHCLGQAADIKVKGHKPRQVRKAIEVLINRGDMLQGGLGSRRYKNFTHYDIRKTKARW